MNKDVIWIYFNVTMDSCLGGLVIVALARNARDQGSIACWDTEFFGPSEPNLTIYFLGFVGTKWLFHILLMSAICARNIAVWFMSKF